jgi:hypothetical protein
MIEKEKILFVNLKVKDKKKNKVIQIEKAVIKENDKIYKGNEIISFEIIDYLGTVNQSKGFDLGVKSEEKRNNITGAYE